MFARNRLLFIAAAGTVVALFINIPAKADDQTEVPGGKGQSASVVAIGQADLSPVDQCHLMRRAISRRVCHSHLYDPSARDTGN